MSLEVLKQVREMENEALAIIEKARQQASDRIATTKTSAAEDVERAHSQARITITEAVNRASQEAELEIQRLRSQHEAKRDEIRREGLQHVNEAVSLILGRMIG